MRAKRKALLWQESDFPIIGLILGLILGLAFWASPAQAGLQIQNEFSQHYNFSDKKSSVENGGSRWILRDLGFATHWRLSTILMTRKNRRLEFLVGPYGRMASVLSLTNYGSSISSVKSIEVGLDIGLSWFGYVRTMLIASPYWFIQFTTSEIFPEDPSKLVEFKAEHWSLGIRIEVPVVKFESEPYDQRVDFGPFACFAMDGVSRFSLTPANFTADGTEDINLTSSISGTQLIGFRWILGVFLNVRVI